MEPSDADVNGFLYDTDPEGLSCPLGAHIRRANPRTGDAPGGKQGPLDNLLVTLGLTFRRDRGRPRPHCRGRAIPRYGHSPGPRTTPWHRPASIASCGAAGNMARRSIARRRSTRRHAGAGSERRNQLHLPQCEYRAAIRIHPDCLDRRSKFAALSGRAGSSARKPRAVSDSPVRRPDGPQRTDGFSRPGAPPNCRHSTGLPQYITVRGGAYFFLPSLTALKWIASDSSARRTSRLAVGSTCFTAFIF